MPIYDDTCCLSVHNILSHGHVWLLCAYFHIHSFKRTLLKMKKKLILSQVSEKRTIIYQHAVLYLYLFFSFLLFLHRKATTSATTATTTMIRTPTLVISQAFHFVNVESSRLLLGNVSTILKVNWNNLYPEGA